jgi:hypothetical protein
LSARAPGRRGVAAEQASSRRAAIRQEAAVDAQSGPSREEGRFREQPNRRLGHLVGLTERPSGPLVASTLAALVFTPRFHDASTWTIREIPPFAAMAAIRLEADSRADGRCLARTGDLLLVRREQLLRSTAACRSVSSASDVPRISAALCCGLSLPRCFHALAPGFTRRRKQGATGSFLSAPSPLPRSCLRTASGLASRAPLLRSSISVLMSMPDGPRIAGTAGLVGLSTFRVSESLGPARPQTCFVLCTCLGPERQCSHSDKSSAAEICPEDAGASGPTVVSAHGRRAVPGGRAGPCRRGDRGAVPGDRPRHGLPVRARAAEHPDRGPTRRAPRARCANVPFGDKPTQIAARAGASKDGYRTATARRTMWESLSSHPSEPGGGWHVSPLWSTLRPSSPTKRTL